MAITHIRDSFRVNDTDDIARRLQRAGVVGAGGAGFPTYAKWQQLDEVDHLLVNHQESEPNCYVDKWLGHEHAERFAALFDALLDVALDVVVIGAKYADRDPWLRPLEAATGGTVYEPSDLPLDVENETGIVFAYTDDKYEYGMESVLLRVTTDTVIGTDLPTDCGWLVQNTETLYNIWRALVKDAPVTRTFVHVDGARAGDDRLRHRMLEVPVGTPANTLLAAVGVDPDGLAADRTLAEGGPGWCFEIERAPSRFGVSKRTNCLLVLDEQVADEQTYGDERINVLEPYDWTRSDPTTEPTRTVLPDRVSVPLVTNPSHDDLVAPADPVVEPGDEVSRGTSLAEPAEGGFSVSHHAPVHGTVTDVTARAVAIRHSGR